MLETMHGNREPVAYVPRRRAPSEEVGFESEFLLVPVCGSSVPLVVYCSGLQQTLVHMNVVLLAAAASAVPPGRAARGEPLQGPERGTDGLALSLQRWMRPNR